jgi:hypothetical protein
VKPKKPRKPDPFKGKKKIIPIRPPEKELSFEEKVEKFGEYMHDPKQHNKIFTELGFTYVDDGCEGGCDSCEQKPGCTVYAFFKDCEMSGEKKKTTRRVVPFKKK